MCEQSNPRATYAQSMGAIPRIQWRTPAKITQPFHQQRRRTEHSQQEQHSPPHPNPNFVMRSQISSHRICPLPKTSAKAANISDHIGSCREDRQVGRPNAAGVGRDKKAIQHGRSWPKPGATKTQLSTSVYHSGCPLLYRPLVTLAPS